MRIVTSLLIIVFIGLSGPRFAQAQQRQQLQTM